MQFEECALFFYALKDYRTLRWSTRSDLHDITRAFARMEVKSLWSIHRRVLVLPHSSDNLTGLQVIARPLVARDILSGYSFSDMVAGELKWLNSAKHITCFQKPQKAPSSFGLLFKSFLDIGNGVRVCEFKTQFPY